MREATQEWSAGITRIPRCLKDYKSSFNTKEKKTSWAPEKSAKYVRQTFRSACKKSTTGETRSKQVYARINTASVKAILL